MKKPLCILFFLFIACAINAQTIKDLFLQTPMDVFPLLNQKDRFAAIRYAELGEMRAVTTAFGDTVEVVQLDDNLLKIKVQDAEYTWCNKWKDEGKEINCLLFIETVCAPRCSSLVRLYLQGWTGGLVATVTPPDEAYKNALFVRADIINDELVFIDETDKYLDETETSISD